MKNERNYWKHKATNKKKSECLYIKKVYDGQEYNASEGTKRGKLRTRNCEKTRKRRRKLHRREIKCIFA